MQAQEGNCELSCLLPLDEMKCRVSQFFILFSCYAFVSLFPDLWCMYIGPPLYGFSSLPEDTASLLVC
jgi:hypothetical protein